MKYKDGLRKIGEMNVAGGPGNVFGYGGAGGDFGTHGGAVGNDPGAWKNSYTNVPIHYLHGDGKSPKKKNKKKSKQKIPMYRRAFIESLVQEQHSQDYILNCVLYTENKQYEQLIQDILHHHNINHLVGDSCVILEGTDDYIQNIINQIQTVTEESPFITGEIIALVGEMDL